MAHQAVAYPGFLCMKQLGVFLLPPGWIASPLQGYPTAHHLYTWAAKERHNKSCVFPKNTMLTQCPFQGLNLEYSL